MVLVLFSVVSAPIIFSQSQLARAELNEAIGILSNDLRWTRAKAIADNKTYRLRVYSVDDIYKTDEDYKADYIIYYLDQDNLMQVIREGSYPDSLLLYKNSSPVLVADPYYDRIRFTGYGTALSGTIGLGDGERIFQVTINQMGRINIEKSK